METNLSMDISKSELLKMLSAYYSEQLTSNVEVKAEVDTELRGYGMGEYMDSVVRFYYSKEENIGQSKVKITTTLSEEEIKDALDKIVSKLNYTVIDMSLKKGTRMLGYYTDEHEAAYFDGVKLNIRQKGINRVLKQGSE